MRKSKKLLALLLAALLVLSMLPATALAVESADGLTNLTSADNWVCDRTEPDDFKIEEGKISFTVKESPAAEEWNAWQGRKAVTGVPVSNAWTVEYTMNITEAMLKTDNVNASLWIQVDEAGEGTVEGQQNCVDWCIVQFIKTEAAAKWQSWDANTTGAWKDVEVAPTEGEHTIKVTFLNGTITQYIDEEEVNTYVISDVYSTSPAAVIAQGRSYGASFDVEIGVPEIDYGIAKIDDTVYATLAAAVKAAEAGDTITLLDDVVLTTGVNVPENKNITVNGQNHTITIDASAGQYVFGNGTVSTEGLKGASELTVNNVNFVSSTKGQNYGVITGSGFNGKVALDNCSFKDMYTAVYMNPNGAAEAELSITNCEYANTTWGYSVDTVSSPGIDKVNVKTTFTGNEIDAAKTFEIFGVAAIYEGDKQIGQYRTLAEAITAVANGENKVITVLPGTIKIGPTETLTLASTGITLKGVRGENGEYLSKIIRDQIPSGNNMFIYVNAANITFEDLYIEYATNDDAWNQRNRPILTSAAADNFKMKNCYLKGPDKANMLLNPGDGADNGLIEGNTFEGGSSGIYIRPCSGTVIKNNTFINNGKCITFEPGETTGFQNVQVSGNTFNIDRKGGTVTGGHRGNTGDYASTIGVKIFPEVKNTTNQGWGEGNVISENTFVNNTGNATYAAYAVIPRSGANDGYTNELIDRISDSFKTDNILPAGALMGYKEVGTTNAATQFRPIYVAPSGGGGGVAYYAVSAASATHGKVTVDKASASAGSTVTITVAPEKGFTLETLTVKDAKGNEVTLTAVKTGETYTFKMPAGKVTVSATFMEDNTMLNFFVDVKADDYFYDAVLWAAKNGITLGVDDTHFAPMAITTRGQMVTFLWRAAGSPEPTATTCAFTDVKADEYYYKAILWAAETGLTKGTSDTTFSPDAEVSRGQTVTFLARLNGVKDDASGYSHNFADVKTTDYYNNAVAWAATNKITDGTSATTFSPDDDCLRGQIVTFLYRNFVK
jgi:parallel beta-helix repeat protein